ncbi:MAG: hypothetical protein WBF53_12425 [Litorimonas sp.]
MTEPLSSCWLALVDESLVRTALFCRPVSYTFTGVLEPFLDWLPGCAVLAALMFDRKSFRWASGFELEDDPFIVPDEIAS